MIIQGKAAVSNGKGTFSIEDIDVHPPRAGEVRVALKASGICHTDYDSPVTMPENHSAFRTIEVGTLPCPGGDLFEVTVISRRPRMALLAEAFGENLSVLSGQRLTGMHLQLNPKTTT